MNALYYGDNLDILRHYLGNELVDHLIVSASRSFHFRKAGIL